MEVLNKWVEEEISQRMREESREEVRRWRPRGGGNRPAVQGQVCDERTVRVSPVGTERVKHWVTKCYGTLTSPDPDGRVFAA